MNKLHQIISLKQQKNSSDCSTIDTDIPSVGQCVDLSSPHYLCDCVTCLMFSKESLSLPLSLVSLFY